ncbi:MAG: hypothetical protein Q4B54_02470 [Coriobacteriales bacterium]|nr:hypothetical protein [Coriobacteriales bacterium]
MSKRVSVALTSALLTAGLMLGACGAPASNSAQSSSAAEATSAQSTAAASTKVDVSEAILGDWKSAQYEVSGITMTGDLNSVMGSAMTLSFANDGKGTFGFNGESVAFSWKAKDDTTVTLTFDKTSDSDVSIDSLDVTYDPELKAISMVMKDESMDGTITFTADGTLKDQPTVDLSKAKAVTSVDQVAGTWKLSGFGSSGVLMIGEGSALSEAAGGTFDPTLAIAADGKITDGSGTDWGTVSIGDDGATVTQSSVTIANLKLYNDSLIMDMSEIAGSETFMIYVK